MILSLINYQAAIIYAYYDGKPLVDMAVFSLLTNYLKSLNADQTYNWVHHWNQVWQRSMDECALAEFIDYCKAIKPFHSNLIHSSNSCLCQLKSKCDDLLWQIFFDNQNIDLTMLPCTSDDNATDKALNSGQQVLKGM